MKTTEAFDADDTASFDCVGGCPERIHRDGDAIPESDETK